MATTTTTTTSTHSTLSEPNDDPSQISMVDNSPPSDPELRAAIEDQLQHEIALQEAGTGSRWL